MKLLKILKEHKMSVTDKNAQAYYYKTIKSLIEATNDLINNYATSDNINQLDKAMYKIDEIVDEAKKMKNLIVSLSKEHYKQK